MIILDSGHHHKLDSGNAYDPGCTFGSFKEADIVHDIKNKLAMKCARMNIPYFIPCYIYDTRERFWQAYKHNPKYYLCLHINSSVNSEASGVEAIYNNAGRQLANDLVWDLVDNLNMVNRKAYHYSKNNRSPAMFDVSGNVPMVLLELGFLSNEADRAKLVNNQDAFVDIIFFTLAKTVGLDFTVFTTGSKTAQKKDKSITLSAPVIQSNNRTYFPLRTLEEIDKDNMVGWLPNHKKAVLYRK